MWGPKKLARYDGSLPSRSLQELGHARPACSVILHLPPAFSTGPIQEMHRNRSIRGLPGIVLGAGRESSMVDEFLPLHVQHGLILVEQKDMNGVPLCSFRIPELALSFSLPSSRRSSNEEHIGMLPPNGMYGCQKDIFKNRIPA